MPLPTSATEPAGLRRRVRELDEAGRLGRAAVHAEQAAEAGALACPPRPGSRRSRPLLRRDLRRQRRPCRGRQRPARRVDEVTRQSPPPARSRRRGRRRLCAAFAAPREPISANDSTPCFGASDLKRSKLYDAERRAFGDRLRAGLRIDARGLDDAGRERAAPAGRARERGRGLRTLGHGRSRPSSPRPSATRVGPVPPGERRTPDPACPRSRALVELRRGRCPTAATDCASGRRRCRRRSASRGALRVTEKSMDMRHSASLGRSTRAGGQRLALLPAGHRPQQVGQAVEVRHDVRGSAARRTATHARRGARPCGRRRVARRHGSGPGTTNSVGCSKRVVRSSMSGSSRSTMSLAHAGLARRRASPGSRAPSRARPSAPTGRARGRRASRRARCLARPRRAPCRAPPAPRRPTPYALGCSESLRTRPPKRSPVVPSSPFFV